MNKVLIITKDVQHARVLNFTLTFNGFITHYASTAEKALKYLEEVHFTLILMDFNFKGTHGDEFYIELQDDGNKLPVVVMGQHYEEISIIDEMYGGMDDYILRPFSLNELKMIINKQLERKRLMSRPVVVGDLRIDVARSLVTIKNKIISLGRKETEILTILAKKAGKVVSRDKLLTEGRIRILSRKLKASAGEALLIHRDYRGFKLMTQVSCG